MQKLTYSAPPITTFPPVTVQETTVTGQEAWRTDIRRPPFYGIYGGPSRAIAPIGVGISTIQRLKMMQPVNPHGVYIPIDKKEGDL